MEYIFQKETLLGPVTLASDGTSLTGLWFDGQKYFGSTLSGPRTDPAERSASELGTYADFCGEAPELPVFTETVRWLDLYFSGRDPGFTPALSFGVNAEAGAPTAARKRGAGIATPFRILVWQELLKIPYGQTVTYGELARRIGTLPAYAQIGKRISARAVGGAVGRNPISLIVPCHRVVGAGGSLTGYAGGVERKRRLLEMEGVHYESV